MNRYNVFFAPVPRKRTTNKGGTKNVCQKARNIFGIFTKKGNRNLIKSFTGLCCMKRPATYRLAHEQRLLDMNDRKGCVSTGSMADSRSHAWLFVFDEECTLCSGLPGDRALEQDEWPVEILVSSLFTLLPSWMSCFSLACC